MEELEFIICACQDAWSEAAELGFDQQWDDMAEPKRGSVEAYGKYSTVE